MNRVSVTHSDDSRALFERMLTLSPLEQKRFSAKLGEEGLDLARLPIPRFGGALAGYPLSSAQTGVWVEERLAPGNPAWNMPAAVRLEGAVDAELLAQALNRVVARHDALRMRFFEQDGRPRQAPVLSRIELEVVTDCSDEQHARKVLVSIVRRPFSLAQGEPLRAALVRLDENSHVFVLVAHHIVSDAWSLNAVMAEVACAFSSLVSGQPVELPAIELDYADFATWEHCRLSCPRLQQDLLARADGLRGVGRLALPAGPERSERQVFDGATISKPLPTMLAGAIQRVAAEQRVTQAMFWMAILEAVLQARFGQKQFLLGMSTSMRTRQELEALVGYLVNLSVIRADLSLEPSFAELLERVRREFSAVYSSLHVPFSRLVDALEPRREPGVTPLVSAVLVVQNHPESQTRVEGLKISHFPIDSGTTRFELTLFVSGGATPELSLQYATHVCDEARAEALLDQFIACARRAVDAPTAAIARLVSSGDGSRRIASTMPKKVVANSRALVELGPFEGSDRVMDRQPVVMTPRHPDFVPEAWLRANREFLQTELCSRGAILLRGFGANSVESFEALVAATGARLTVDNGELPRLKLGERVFTAVDYPANERIHWHNENAFYRRWPGNIWFGCLRAASRGGATPIVDGRRMLETLPVPIVERMARTRLMYVRNYRHGLGLSWSDVFGVATRTEVEQKCSALGVDCEWVEGGLRTRSVRPAVVRHPRTNELVWFNQITHWHPACLPAALRQTLDRHYHPDDMPRYVRFEDGEEIPESVIDEICRAYQTLETAHPWEEGDVLLIDNLLVSHARQSFEGPRKLVIAMGNMIDEDEVAAFASGASA